MARKKLLTESEIRQFMKLANIKPLSEGGKYPLPEPGQRKKKADDNKEEAEELDEYGMPGARDDEEDAPEMDAEMEMDVEAPAPEGGEEMEMDAEMGEEPAGDMEMDMGGDDMGMDMGADGGKEEQFADIVDKLADLLGLDADVEVGGDEEMGGDAMPDEGGDDEMGMDAPEEEPEDMGGDDDEELMGEEEIVAEVARRVAARLIREKKQDAMANRLAERIFRRLASK